MKIRTVISALLIVSLVAACDSPAASPSANSTPVPTSTASPAPSPISTPSPIVTPDPEPPAAGPLTVPGELNFGSDNFGGVPYGQVASVYGVTLSANVHTSACGDIATGPMLFANVPSTPPWGLFLKTDWDAPGVGLANATVQSFLLVVQSQTRPTSPIGPVGPLGIRLGTPEATIVSMFPTEAANLNYRTTTIIDYATDAEVNVSERIISIADVDGGPMIISTLDGVVVTIMWGNPDYVHPQLGQLYCP